MRHISTYSLFEATKSKILGKTLRRVEDSRTRTEILDIIKGICQEKGDMPPSELSDKYFRYDRKSAKNVSLGANEHVACPKCGGDGYVLFSTGTKKTSVSRKLCGECKGEGFSYPADKELYKFWLTEDGKLKAATMVDGRYYGSLNKIESWETEKLTLPEDNSESIIDMKVQEEFMSKNGIVPGKTRLILEQGRGSWNNESRIGVFWQDNAGDYHFINQGIGSTKTRGSGVSIAGTKWKDLGSHHISLERMSSDTRGYRLYKITSDAPKEDPYQYNMKVRAGYRGVVNKTFVGIEDDDIKGADYVVMFDADKYSKDAEAGEFTPTGDTKAARAEARKGAAALLDPSDVKKANLERYRQDLTNINLKAGLGTLVRKTPNILGGSNFLLFSMKDTFRWSFTRLLDDLYDYLETAAEGKDAEYKESQVVGRMKGMVQDNINQNANYKNFLMVLREKLGEHDERLLAEFNRVHAEFDRISLEYKRKFFSKQYQTVEQLYSIAYKLRQLDELEGDRRLTPDYVRLISISSYVSSNAPFNALIEEFDENGDLSRTMDRMAKFEDIIMNWT